MRHFFRSLAVVLGVVVFAGPALVHAVAPSPADDSARTEEPRRPAATPAPIVPDQSTPKGAALLFANAMLASDTAAVRSLAVGDDAKLRMIESLAQMIGAVKRLSDASVEAFGKENVVLRSFDEMNLDMISRLEAAEVQITGDSATITHRDQRSKSPDRFVRRDGKWFVDLSGMPAEHGERIATFAPLMTRVANETTAEIRQKKYKTAEEAHRAMESRIMAASAPPTTRPATQKATDEPSSSPGSGK